MSTSIKSAVLAEMIHNDFNDVNIVTYGTWNKLFERTKRLYK